MPMESLPLEEVIGLPMDLELFMLRPYLSSSSLSLLLRVRRLGGAAELLLSL